MMREAKIVLPATAFDSEPELFNRFTHALAQEYGGYTLTTGTGAYADEQGKAHHEVVHIFTIGMMPEDFQSLRSVAMGFIMLRGEQSVYLVDTGGCVHICTADDVTGSMAEAATSDA